MSHTPPTTEEQAVKDLLEIRTVRSLHDKMKHYMQTAITKYCQDLNLILRCELEVILLKLIKRVARDASIKTQHVIWLTSSIEKNIFTDDLIYAQTYGGNGFFIFALPPQERIFSFSRPFVRTYIPDLKDFNSNVYRTSLYIPYQYFIVQVHEGFFSSLHAFVSVTPPSEAAILHPYPLPNVDETGKVCVGEYTNQLHPSENQVEFAREAVHYFLSGIHTTDLPKVFTTFLTSTKLENLSRWEEATQNQTAEEIFPYYIDHGVKIKELLKLRIASLSSMADESISNEVVTAITKEKAIYIADSSVAFTEALFNTITTLSNKFAHGLNKLLKLLARAVCNFRN